MVVWASLVVQLVKNLPAMQETRVQSLSLEDTLEKGMAIHSRILAWKIPWTEEPGRLPSMGLKRVGHNWVTNTFTFSFHFSLMPFGTISSISIYRIFLYISIIIIIYIVYSSDPNYYVFWTVVKVMSNSLWPHGLQHTRFPCPSLSPGICSNSYLLSWSCHPNILSSVTIFSSCPQSFPASGSFQIS